MADTAETPIDQVRLESFTNGDRDLEAELAGLFLETAQLYTDRLRQSLDDAAAWQRAAHALKGASANIGAVVVAQLAAEQEQAEPRPEALREIERQIVVVREHFRTRGSLPER